MERRGVFEDFYAEHRDRVFRVVLLAIGNRHQAEDCVAEAFVRAWERWDRLAEHPNPAGWVVKTALNVHRSAWRRLRREVLGRSEPASVMAEEEIHVGLAEIVGGLPRRQREVIALRVFLDMSVEQTAEVLGITTGSVKTHLHRGLESLRRLPGFDGGEGMS